MIDIRNEKDCCGCGACTEICPRNCLSMIPDRYGFPYPVVKRDECVDCGMCNKVCPIENTNAPRRPIASYAFMHKDMEVRKRTSTGGAFVAMAEKVLLENGVVFGCVFDSDWSAKHIGIDNRMDLNRLVGSKYLQSRMGGCFRECKTLLEKRRKVLFSGTPCQISGLRRFLRRDYDNLICVDLICHGVPAPGIWQKYLHEQRQKMSLEKGEPLFVKNVNFRDKTRGWASYSLSLSLSLSNQYGHVYENPPQTWFENTYMLSFLRHLNMRPSCFHCRFRNLRSGSDITIGDFWRFTEVHPKIVDDKIGINALIINTEKGRIFVDGIDFDGCESSWQKIVFGNRQLVMSPWSHINRKKFMESVNKTDDFDGLVADCLRMSLLKKCLSKARTFYHVYLKHHKS